MKYLTLLLVLAAMGGGCGCGEPRIANIDGHVWTKPDFEWRHDPGCPKCKERS